MTAASCRLFGVGTEAVAVRVLENRKFFGCRFEMLIVIKFEAFQTVPVQSRKTQSLGCQGCMGVKPVVLRNKINAWYQKISNGPGLLGRRLTFDPNKRFFCRQFALDLSGIQM